MPGNLIFAGHCGMNPATLAFSIQHWAFSTETEWNVKNFRDLQVWEKAHQLTLAAYEATG
jgi:hypothetical protein